MKATLKRHKNAWFVFTALAVFSVFISGSASFLTNAKSDDFDAAAIYKAKCLMCHGPKAEKKFDVTSPDDQLVAAILSGKKGEKPPNMPEYQSKGVTADQAAALVAYMKSLKQ